MLGGRLMGSTLGYFGTCLSRTLECLLLLAWGSLTRMGPVPCTWIDKGLNNDDPTSNGSARDGGLLRHEQLISTRAYPRRCQVPLSPSLHLSRRVAKLRCVMTSIWQGSMLTPSSHPGHFQNRSAETPPTPKRRTDEIVLIASPSAMCWWRW
jgi:hypothetical protein